MTQTCSVSQKLSTRCWNLNHEQLDWLDKHIIEQANHWSISPKDKADLFNDAAEFGEMLENGTVEEPESNKMIKLDREYITASGNEVTLITVEGRGRYPVVGYIGENSQLQMWDQDGRSSGPQDYDLKVKPKTLYIRIASNGTFGVFSNEAQAIKSSIVAATTLEIKYVPGTKDF